MQLENLFHISTKEERKKVAKKERRTVAATTTAPLSTFLRTGLDARLSLRPLMPAKHGVR